MLGRGTTDARGEDGATGGSADERGEEGATGGRAELRGDDAATGGSPETRGRGAVEARSPSSSECAAGAWWLGLEERSWSVTWSLCREVALRLGTSVQATPTSVPKRAEYCTSRTSGREPAVAAWNGGRHRGWSDPLPCASRTGGNWSRSSMTRQASTFEVERIGSDRTGAVSVRAQDVRGEVIAATALTARGVPEASGCRRPAPRSSR